METKKNRELIAFLEVDLEIAADAELKTGMDLYFIKVTPTEGIKRVYFKFFNDIDAAIDFFYVKHRLANLKGFYLSTAVARFQWNNRRINLYDVNKVLSTTALEKLENSERDQEWEVSI
jgi:hypothetical protein